MTPQEIQDCRQFIGPSQFNVMLAASRGEEGAWFRQKIADLAQQFATMPKTYDTEPSDYLSRVQAYEAQGMTSSDAQSVCDAEDQRGPIVHLHYFRGSADWYIVERDIEQPQHQAYGYADLFGDSGELGYISIVEIIRGGAELDLHWTPKPLPEVIARREAA